MKYKIFALILALVFFVIGYALAIKIHGLDIKRKMYMVTMDYLIAQMNLQSDALRESQENEVAQKVFKCVIAKNYMELDRLLIDIKNDDSMKWEETYYIQTIQGHAAGMKSIYNGVSPGSYFDSMCGGFVQHWQ